eukprot:TRINITY_DN23843_c0_g2_i2.p1 TRINITY_DN23843_c0_g2~~TRINITY_DN23843_c0_g2_i2.p1  ORF type:complete len:718 (+),score=225.32 TRINITY_DN23843_c0_g2_i2:188-2341(+)
MLEEGDDPREESIKVCCRIRPMNTFEQARAGRSCVDVSDSGTTVRVTTTDHVFAFDRVFRSEATQKEVYDYAAKPIINGVLKGFNGTVFAYGQTASGKTYTMEGPDIEDKESQGVIPRMVWSLFDGIYQAEEHLEFLAKVSIVEIYNERIRDLLDPKKDNLKVHEDKARGVFIGDVTESYVGREQEIFDAMRVGQYNRSMAETNMNEHSSRSHLVFMMTVEQKNLHDRSVKVGKLHLVDLAGSEKVGKTGTSGERLDEARNINRSLSALGNVINALTDKKTAHVPYRDSKLTRVLQESLGGNSKTSLIITCSPSVLNESETISTCRFGQRAKMIKNVVKVNLERSTEELKAMLERRDGVVQELRSRISSCEQLLRARGISIPEALGAVRSEMQGESSPATRDLQERLQEARVDFKEGSDHVAHLRRERDELWKQVRSQDEERQRLQIQLADAATEREKLEYERTERMHEVMSTAKDKEALMQIAQDLQNARRCMQQLRSVPTEDLATGGSFSSTSSFSRGGGASSPVVADVGGLSVASFTSTAAPSERGGVGAQPEARDADDRPLKRKVSQLDKNLEQLTVMYHKLVAQNSGLKVEVGESDKKIQRKDQRIAQLEKNLREAKQKYEKLLTQCANLTAAMDVMGRSRTQQTPGSVVAGSANAALAGGNASLGGHGGALAATGSSSPVRRFSSNLRPLRNSLVQGGGDGGTEDLLGGGG